MWLAQWFKWLKVPTSISLSAVSAAVWKWSTYQLISYIFPEPVNNNKVYYSKSNNNIDIDDNWLVTWITDWTSIVTATTEIWWLTATCTFTVFTVDVTWITLNETECNLWAWDTLQLIATITPDNATNKNVTWTSSNTSIATVDNNWLVTSISEWECTITATTVDWWYTATCSILPIPSVSQTFTYTWSDQDYTIPYSTTYKVEAWWAWSRSAKWWYWSWVIYLTKWTELKIMVWARWNNWNWAKYWFSWGANGWGNAAWWWMSWVFTWSWTITNTDSARALVIWWWAWGSSAWTWWAWWWETWWTWSWSYWSPWSWWTQTWRWSSWNKWGWQFSWWGWSWTYWYWGWGWRRWGNGSQWDSSADDDKWGWWWSWYVISTASDRILTSWWWSAAWTDWCVKITHE